MTFLIDGLSQFIGVLLGVVAGTAITVLAQKWIYRQSKKDQIKNLKSELELNVKKIDDWIEEIGKYRNKVNGDSLLNYFGYFRLSSIVGVTASQLHASGTIYKYLPHEQIGLLQELFNELSINGENYINNQIAQRKEALNALKENGAMQQWQQYLKPEIDKDIDFWEGKFKTHLASLKTIRETLKKF